MFTHLLKCRIHVWNPVLFSALEINAAARAVWGPYGSTTKTELHKKLHIQVSVSELHIDMLNNCATGFPTVYDENVLVCISYYDI